VAKAASTANQQAYALISLYVKCYEQKYGVKPGLNRYKEKWAFQDVVDDLGYERARETVEFYFTTGRVGHPLNYFLYNYEKLDELEKELKEDEANRLALREQTRLKVQEWEAAHGNN